MKKTFLLFLFCSQVVFAQEDTLKSLKMALGIEAGIYATSIYSLNKLWYQDYPRSSFHWHNDNNAWLQMDKLGHAFSAYQVGLLGIDIFECSGISKKKSIWFGGTYGTVFLTTIEILDGYSQGWGASWGDLIANTSGTALLISQELLWEEQRVQMKYSFFPTEYANINPDLLGKNLTQQLIKDYNGQTIWISANINSFLNDSRIPKWLNIAIGHGVDGMINGASNSSSNRQFYLSFDIDLRRVKTGSDFLNKTLKVLSFIKIPFPAVLLTDNFNVQFFPIHYGQ